MSEETGAVPERRTGRVLQVQVDVMSHADAIHRLLRWAKARESRAVSTCNVHVVVSASQNRAYRDVINRADMAAPDGAPVAWMLRRLGFAGQPRISGPDLMWALCARCAEEGLPVYFYGSTEATLAALRNNLHDAFPGLPIAGMKSPPFGEMAEAEDAAAVADINAVGPCIVFVGLGCPTQDFWADSHRGRVNAVMIGVGAAFDFHAGALKRAPQWMQDHGLEWLHRLASEPRRLGRRYLVTNTVFVFAAARQLLLGPHS